MTSDRGSLAQEPALRRVHRGQVRACAREQGLHALRAGALPGHPRRVELYSMPRGLRNAACGAGGVHHVQNRLHRTVRG